MISKPLLYLLGILVLAGTITATLYHPVPRPDADVPDDANRVIPAPVNPLLAALSEKNQLLAELQELAPEDAAKREKLQAKLFEVNDRLSGNSVFKDPCCAQALEDYLETAASQGDLDEFERLLRKKKNDIFGRGEKPDPRYAETFTQVETEFRFLTRLYAAARQGDREAVAALFPELGEVFVASFKTDLGTMGNVTDRRIRRFADAVSISDKTLVEEMKAALRKALASSDYARFNSKSLEASVEARPAVLEYQGGKLEYDEALLTLPSNSDDNFLERRMNDLKSLLDSIPSNDVCGGVPALRARVTAALGDCKIAYLDATFSKFKYVTDAVPKPLFTRTLEELTALGYEDGLEAMSSHPNRVFANLTKKYRYSTECLALQESGSLEESDALYNKILTRILEEEDASAAAYGVVQLAGAIENSEPYRVDPQNKKRELREKLGASDRPEIRRLVYLSSLAEDGDDSESTPSVQSPPPPQSPNTIAGPINYVSPKF